MSPQAETGTAEPNDWVVVPLRDREHAHVARRSDGRGDDAPPPSVHGTPRPSNTACVPPPAPGPSASSVGTMIYSRAAVRARRSSWKRYRPYSRYRQDRHDDGSVAQTQARWLLYASSSLDLERGHRAGSRRSGCGMRPMMGSYAMSRVQSMVSYGDSPVVVTVMPQRSSEPRQSML